MAFISAAASQVPTRRHSFFSSFRVISLPILPMHRSFLSHQSRPKAPIPTAARAWKASKCASEPPSSEGASETTAVTAASPRSACTAAICAASSPLMMKSRALVLCVKIQPTLRSLRAPPWALGCMQIAGRGHRNRHLLVHCAGDR